MMNILAAGTRRIGLEAATFCRICGLTGPVPEPEWPITAPKQVVLGSISPR